MNSARHDGSLLASRTNLLIVLNCCQLLFLMGTLSKGWGSPHGSGSLIWYCSSIEEDLLCFSSKQFHCQLSLNHTYTTSSPFGAISIYVFVKVMLILSITAALIFQSRAAFCTCTRVSLMCPILPDSLTFCLQTPQIRALHYASESSQIVGLITPSALWMPE